MTDLLLIFRPRGLRSANRAASIALYSAALSYGSDLVVADLPEGMEPLLMWPGASPSSILEAAVELGWLPNSQSTLRVLEPLIEGLVSVRRSLGVEVRCYVPPTLFKEHYELQVEVPRLLLRASIRGLTDRDLDEWLDLVDRGGELSRRYLSSAAERVAELSSRRRRPICLAGLEAWELAKRLRVSGMRVELRSTGLPYLFTPLEVASLLASRGMLTRDLLRQLILEHLEYVKQYVMKYEDLDQAHDAWTHDKAPWIHGFTRGYDA